MKDWCIKISNFFSQCLFNLWSSLKVERDLIISLWTLKEYLLIFSLWQVSLGIIHPVCFQEGLTLAVHIPLSLLLGISTLVCKSCLNPSVFRVTSPSSAGGRTLPLVSLNPEPLLCPRHFSNICISSLVHLYFVLFCWFIFTSTEFQGEKVITFN